MDLDPEIAGISGLSEHQIWAISITGRIASSISLLSVLFILFTYSLSPVFNKPINRTIFFATWSNLGICLAGLISVDGYLEGQGSSLCRFQAFLVQMFLGVDAYFALCMSINVYLAFFSGFTIQQLPALDIRYLVICYGASAIPALVFLFINVPPRGPIYGNAWLWCWIDDDWDFLRLAIVYAICWAAILLSLIVYIMAGRVIYKRRHEFDGFWNPLNEAPFANIVTTEVTITHEDRNTSTSHIEDGAPAGLEPQEQDDQIYSVNVEAAPQERTHGMSDVLNLRSVTRGIAASESNAESWLYARVAFLFFLALIITWIPSSVNRIYNVLHPNAPSFGLTLTSAILLPLQGFWNLIVYTVTSRTACKRLWDQLCGRPLPPILVENRRKRDGSGEQSLIGERIHGGRRIGGSLSSIKSRLSRERRGRTGGGRERVDEVMMGKIGRERLGSKDREENR